LLEGKLKSVTVSRNPSGEYYAACLYDDGKDKPFSSSEGKAIGVDMGINHYVITSDGTKHGNPKYYRKYEVKLAKRQKQLTLKQKESSNRNKARIKVAKVHERITRCREDFLQKLSRKLVDENQVLVVENLAVRNLVKNYKLAKLISDAGWGKFCTMLKHSQSGREESTSKSIDFFPVPKLVVTAYIN
jgi:putative transposase